MHWKKPLAVAGVVVVLAGGGVAYAAAAVPSKVAVCANVKNGGYVRLLEPKNLAKSQFGKCRKNEVKVPLTTTAVKGPKGDAGPAGPAGPAVKSWTWVADGVTYTCADPDGDLAYTCTGVAPSPSPSPSAT
jgi:hypothetical protein